VIKGNRPARQQVPGRERAPGELECELAVQHLLVLVMRHSRKQDVAAEASVERIRSSSPILASAME
jgi:hypothetical protein